MRSITREQVAKRLVFDNPWWTGGGVDEEVRGWPRRDYFKPFRELALDLSVRRAVVLMGPRRVGKTVLLQQLIAELLGEGSAPESVMFASLDTPTYLELSLDELIGLYFERFGHDRGSRVFVFLDEIQYRKDWELHLKSLVDSFPRARFIVSGSAAAALKLKSRESGAGRFTEFVLPPLTFKEYLRFSGGLRAQVGEEAGPPPREDIQLLNSELVNYLNFGAFPEAALSLSIQRDPGRYIRQDILDKVLLRDLPGLYGIEDIQELYRLFSMLAYNTGQELNIEALSQKSGVSKVTLRRYLEYLEAAFLVRVLKRVDDRGQRFKRQTAFKVYLTNPAMRAALFGPVGPEDEAMGAMVETAIVSQLAHAMSAFESFSYARWKEGGLDLEVDLVSNDVWGALAWLIEVKWSDRPWTRPEELRALERLLVRHPSVSKAMVTTRTVAGSQVIGGRAVEFLPSAEACLSLGESASEAGMLLMQLTAKIDAALSARRQKGSS